jgi:hypothetical protein
LAGTCGDLQGLGWDLAMTWLGLGYDVVNMNIAHNIYFFHSNTTYIYTLNLHNSTMTVEAYSLIETIKTNITRNIVLTGNKLNNDYITDT